MGQSQTRLEADSIQLIDDWLREEQKWIREQLRALNGEGDALAQNSPQLQREASDLWKLYIKMNNLYNKNDEDRYDLAIITSEQLTVVRLMKEMCTRESADIVRDDEEEVGDGQTSQQSVLKNLSAMEECLRGIEDRYLHNKQNVFSTLSHMKKILMDHSAIDVERIQSGPEVTHWMHDPPHVPPAPIPEDARNYISAAADKLESLGQFRFDRSIFRYLKVAIHVVEDEPMKLLKKRMKRPEPTPRDTSPQEIRDALLVAHTMWSFYGRKMPEGKFLEILDLMYINSINIVVEFRNVMNFARKYIPSQNYTWWTEFLVIFCDSSPNIVDMGLTYCSAVDWSGDVYTMIENPIDQIIFFRVCVFMGETELAESWIELIRSSAPDRQSLEDLRQKTAERWGEKKHTMLPVDAPQVYEVNGDVVDVTDSDYLIPVFRHDLERCTFPEPEKPTWWEEEFKEITQSEEAITETVEGARLHTVERTGSKPESRKTSESVTGGMSQSADCGRLKLDEGDIRSDNREYTVRLLQSRIIKDDDLKNMVFIAEKLKYEGKGDVHHCLLLSYYPIENHWVVKPDLIRVDGQLAVEQPGALRETLCGELGIGIYLGEDESSVQTQTEVEEPVQPAKHSYIFKQSKNDHTFPAYLADIRVQATARYYSARFDELIEEEFGKMNMLGAQLVLILDPERLEVVDMMTAEISFAATSTMPLIEYTKYTNNASYVNRSVNNKMATAYSHFTFQDSQGVLMVTDIQGWETQLDRERTYIYTDPWIECPNAGSHFSVKESRDGMHMFWVKQHPDCNEICQFLQLKRP